MIRLEDVTLAPGGHEVVRGASFHLHPGDHVGLVGRNGSGKTTLLRAVVGELLLDGGHLEVRPGIRVGWLPQQAVSGSNRPVWDEAKSGMTRLLALADAVSRAERAVAIDPAAADQLFQATEQFRMAGGYAADEKIGEVLHGLGFSPTDWHRTCDTFSGGWQMRIALARLLLSDPDVALLDEPTNHLDLEARSWLARYLQAAPWAFVVVSHDRFLLDRCTTSIAEIRGGRLRDWPGNFSAFLRQRDAWEEQQRTAAGRQDAEIARLERFVERFGAKATKAAQARSKQKAIDRIDRIELPEPDAKRARIRFPESPPSAQEAVGLVRATIGWTPEQAVLTDVTLSVDRGMRIAVLGANGTGKSTILQTLAGRLTPISGRRRLGDRVRIGVFDQDQAQALPPDRAPLDHLADACPTVPPERIRTVLGSLGLPGGMALRLIGALSGGEKARVALALLVVRPCNVLLLDEPTNHLDVETVDVLVDALASYDGAMLLVSHDRFVVEKLATHIARIGPDGVVTLREGVLPEDFERAPLAKSGPAAPNEAAVAHDDRKKRTRELERSRRRLVEVQKQIPVAELTVRDVDEAMIPAATDHLRLAQLVRDRRAAEATVASLYEEWEKLEAELEAG